MAPTTRNQHSSKPSSPPATYAPVPPLSSHQSFPLLPSPSSSSQPGSKTQLQIEEIQGSVTTLQNEVFQSINTLPQNQTSFQNQIVSQISALQNTLMQTLTLLQPPNLPPPNSPPLNENPTPPNPPPPNDNHCYRPPKVDLPRFNGDDALGWLTMPQRYLRSQHVPLPAYVATVASHFGPDACMWMNSFEERNPEASWESFASSFLEHYGAGNITDIQTALSHLEQTNTVDEFIVAFTKLSSRAYGWSEVQLLPIFLGGLKH